MAEFITPTAAREALGNGVYRNVISLAPVAYADASGVLRPISDQWADGDATYPHVVSAARLRVRTAPNGDRLLLPVPGDDEAWFSISSPFINVGGNWTQPSLGTFTRTGNRLRAQTANVDTYIWHLGHGVKAGFELKNGWLPANNQFAFRVGLNGLTRDGGTLLYNGTPVMQLRKPVAYDWNNPADTREIAHEFVQFNGNWHVLFTLPDTTGMDRVVVDPTFSAQPDGTAGEDSYIFDTIATANRGTNASLFVGDATAAYQAVRTLIKFDLSSIPSGSTVSAATVSLYEDSALDTDSVGTWNTNLVRLLQNWVEGEVTWNIYSTGNDWNTAGASGSGTDRAASSSASVTSDGTAATAFVDWTSATLIDDVQKFINGTYNNYGWLIESPAAESNVNQSYTRYVSSDGTTASQRPKLVIEYTVTAIMTGLTAWYTLDETSGTRADSYTGGYDLTDNNTVLYDTGKVSNAAAFVSANSEFLDYQGGAAAFDFTGDFTVCAWINATTFPSLASIVTKEAGAATDTTWIFRTSSTGSKPEFYVASGSSYLGPAAWGSDLSTGTWYFVVAWFDDTANEVYLSVNNGTAVSAAAVGSPNAASATDLIIGARAVPATRRAWNGLIDEVAIYSRVLTPDERTWLYNSGNGRTYEDLASYSAGGGGTTIPVVMHHRRTQGMS